MPLGATDFKSVASTSSAIPARSASPRFGARRLPRRRDFPSLTPPSGFPDEYKALEACALVGSGGAAAGLCIAGVDKAAEVVA